MEQGHEPGPLRSSLKPAAIRCLALHSSRQRGVRASGLPQSPLISIAFGRSNWTYFHEDENSWVRERKFAMKTILFRNVRVVDGTGAPWFRGDVLVRGDRIAEVRPTGLLTAESTHDVIEGKDRVLSPGFIDIQSHSITSLFTDGRCISKISQGITTEIMGETWTPAPLGGQYTKPRGMEQGWERFGQWLDAMENRGVSPNVGSFLAAHTLRRHVMGMRLGVPTSDELRQMQQVMATAMKEGAFGVSYALIYPPDAFASTEEIIAICKPVAENGGIYITHLRSEGDRFLEALEEAITIGREAALPVEVYHLKASGQNNWHKMDQAIARIAAARADGIDVAADMYPYVASGTGLSACLPASAAADHGLFANLRDPVSRDRIREDARKRTGDWGNMSTPGGAGNVMPVDLRLPDHQKYIGMRLDAIASDMGLDPLDAVIELLLREEQRIFTIYFKMSERNLIRQVAQPWMKFATDAGAYDPETARSGHPVHPRSYGSMPRILGRYVRDWGALSLEDAIHKMTWQVACRLHLTDRGRLQPGAMADLVLFDPDTVADQATFEDSHQLSVGIDGVWVNGVRVWTENGHTGATPGRAVRGPGAVS